MHLTAYKCDLLLFHLIYIPATIQSTALAINSFMLLASINKLRFPACIQIYMLNLGMLIGHLLYYCNITCLLHTRAFCFNISIISEPLVSKHCESLYAHTKILHSLVKFALIKTTVY